MADNLRKYTTQEVLNKVYTDSSGDTIGLQAQTSKETLNAVLNTSTNSLNVSLSGSNTISGDVTITGDLTVQGSGGAVYDEIIEGSLHIKTASSGQATADTAADELVVENSGSGGISILTPDNSLGQLAFGSASDAYGAFIGWKHDDNQMTIATANAGDSIVLQTANKTTALTIDSSQNATFAKGVTISNGNLDIAATKKLFFDAGGDTYIHEQAANKLDFFVGNGTRFVLDANSRISLTNNDGSGGGTTVFGYQSGGGLVSGGINMTLYGYQAGNAITNGDNNTLIGKQSGYQGTYGLTTGSDNTALGSGSFGSSAGANITGNYNTAIGSQSMLEAEGTVANNTAVGYQSLVNLTNGGGNTAVGSQAMGLGAVTGANNTAIGHGAGYDISSGHSNVIVGKDAGVNVDSGTENTIVGHQAGAGLQSGTVNTLVGLNAGGDVTGSSNTLIGANAGHSGSNDLVGANNCVFIGRETAGSSASANNQIVIGKGEVGYGDYTASIGGTVLGLNVPNTMSSPYYRFDGTDDKIDCGNNFDLSSGDFSVSAWVYYIANTSAGGIVGIRANGATPAELQLYIENSTLKSWNGSTNISSTASIPDQKWTHIVMAQDGSNKLFYINGVLDSTQSQANGASSSETLKIGHTGHASEYFKGSIAGVQIWNKAVDATEVKELYSGASVPFKYKGANQTNLLTNGTFDSNTTGWSAVRSTLASVSGGQSGNCLEITRTGDPDQSAFQSFTTVIGKIYRISAYVKDGSVTGGAFTIQAWNGSDAVGVINGTTTSSWVRYSSTFTATTTSHDITLRKNNSSAGTMLFDTVRMEQIGAVAEYDGSGIASDKWFDKSGNDLHGTIASGSTGATVENAPSGDDGLVYEEGTWDAGLSFGSGSASLNSSYNTGKYIRVGNVVHVQGYFALSSISSPSGDTLITGLPFTNPDHVEGQEFSAVSIRMTDLASAMNGFPQGFISSNATTIFLEKFQEDGTNAGTSRELGTHIGASTTIILNATYQI